MSKGRHKKAHAAEHENAERWLLTYADLITLLMVFFVVLYSMSSADTTKFKAVSAALQQAFNLDVLQGQFLHLAARTAAVLPPDCPSMRATATSPAPGAAPIADTITATAEALCVAARSGARRSIAARAAASPGR